MRVFEADGKINFVDEQNVVVGFSNERSCCERFGWGLSDPGAPALPAEEPDGRDFPGWMFDPTYFKKGVPANYDGWYVIFRLVNGDQERFLSLYNHHNGYYSHGFEMSVGGVVAQRGAI